MRFVEWTTARGNPALAFWLLDERHAEHTHLFTGEEGACGAEHLTVLRFEDSVRNRPAMYFRVGQLRAVIMDALHSGEGEHPNVGVEITRDLRFTVTLHHVADESGRPRLSFFDSLLSQSRWAPASTTIEVCASDWSPHYPSTYRKSACPMRRKALD
ncbi:hypothetical protein [Herbidospora daliensis]|uniref:hypothetical protein n=1 Tax=Herbidospora daliensis TaxID=295585 RepID=UPI0012F7F565|nr:hypothetical protein [Herbidospora daliensis]